MLTVEDVSVVFDSTTAVNRATTTVTAGEIVCVLGPSGCGKTTLLGAIAGLVPLAAGRITFDGADLAGVPPHLRRFGLMFQDYALFPHHDVAGNVAFGLRMQRLGRAEVAARTAEALELVGLEGFGPRSIATLSGGERQRVALARALAPRPRLLLLDEPLGSLDRTLRERLTRELRSLLTAIGMTAIYVTHDQEEAFALGDRVAVMNTGAFVQVGAPTEVWARPATAFVARFLGDRALVPATVADGVVSAPWGELHAPPDAPSGPALAVLRADSLVVDDAGPIAGVVVGRVFRGDHFLVRVACEGLGELDVAARGAAVPERDERVRLAVIPDRIALVPPN